MFKMLSLKSRISLKYENKKTFVRLYINFEHFHGLFLIYFIPDILDYFKVRIKSHVRADELYSSRGNGNLSHGN